MTPPKGFVGNHTTRSWDPHHNGVYHGGGHHACMGIWARNHLTSVSWLKLLYQSCGAQCFSNWYSLFPIVFKYFWELYGCSKWTFKWTYSCIFMSSYNSFITKASYYYMLEYLTNNYNHTLFALLFLSEDPSTLVIEKSIKKLAHRS